MNSLLPPGSSSLERRLVQACSGISDLSVSLRDLWNPWKCPVKFLPYLAWAFSVDRWEETWSEREKRQAVSDAFWIHQRKGTVAAVRRVIENLGYSMTLQEWWEVADPAGTFRLEIDLKDIGITETMIKELERIIGDARPVSRHIARLSLSAGITGPVYTGAASCGGEVISVYPPEYTPDEAARYDGGGFHSGSVTYTENQRGEDSHRYDGRTFHDGRGVYAGE